MMSTKHFILVFFGFSLTFLLIIFIPKAQAHGNGPARPIGFASLGSGTTGGAGGATVTVDNYSDLKYYAQQTNPYIIQVRGSIAIPERLYIESYKTIIGIGKNAAITNVGLGIGHERNVIIRNITFRNTRRDSIKLMWSDHIWIDHNTFTMARDELLDISLESSYVTVSWNKFYNSRFACLVGSANSRIQNRGKLKVTFHHNWFEGTPERNPYVRFGEVHVYNNYFEGNNYADGNGYTIGVGVEAKIYSEKNYFESDMDPTKILDTYQQPGYIKDIGSYLVNSKTPQWRPNGLIWNPSNYYNYTPDPAASVKSIVIRRAGAGKI